jgi:hypothetical protein
MVEFVAGELDRVHERIAGRFGRVGGPAFSGQLNLRYFMLRAAGSGIR